MRTDLQRALVKAKKENRMRLRKELETEIPHRFPLGIQPTTGQLRSMAKQIAMNAVSKARREQAA